METVRGWGKVMHSKGQTPIEIIGITIVLVALLFLVIITSFVKNNETMQLQEFNENSAQCNEMGATIVRMYSNRATTIETINIEVDSTIQRVEGKSGGISVRGFSCAYVGSVQKSTGEKDSDPNGTGADGITLAVGVWCLEKTPDTNVVATQGECA